MEFDINIHTGVNGEITINDYSYQNDQYYPEDQSDYSENKYKYSDCKTINILTKVSTDKSQIVEILINNHAQFTDNIDYVESDSFIVTHDGYYTITHIIIPTVDWYNNIYTQLSEDYKSQFGLVYFIGNDNKFYKLIDNVKQECSKEELCTRNSNNTTLKKCELKIFYMEFLQQCYLNYCKNLFSEITKTCDYVCKNQDFDDITYKRDLLWMVINILTYHVNFSQLNEAQRILEITMGCNNFCQGGYLYAKHRSSCGCT